MAGTMRTSRIVVAAILTVVLLAPLGAQSDSARLKRLEDIQEMQTLFLNYGWKVEIQAAGGVERHSRQGPAAGAVDAITSG